ncbi:MAG: DUF3570 domain-containing protein [Methylococcaceae bacterium]|nr:MAG: DUF3570 domain-containing protein [Methylococcaceae bacterium]
MAVTDALNGKLAALTAAALALPGMAPKAHAELTPQNLAVDNAFSHYEEGLGRMRVDIYQGTASGFLGDNLSFRLNGVRDAISGASPLAVAPNTALTRFSGLCKGLANTSKVQCMSGASIRDVRDALDLGVNYTLDNLTLGLGGGHSEENDYVSNFFNIDTRWDINQKLTTLAASFGYAADSVWAVAHNNGVMTRVDGKGGDKDTFQGLLGITQVLDKNSLLQANVTYTQSKGYLSDPYKFAYVAPAVNVFSFPPKPYYDCPTEAMYQGTGYCSDSRPSGRQQAAFLLRYVRHFSELNAAALHLDYRLYGDSFGIVSHTLESSWIQPVGHGFQLTPRIRYYSQNAADFYQPFFNTVRADGHYTSDYRMANFGAISGGITLSKQLTGHLRLSAAAEYYQREKNLAMSGGAGTALDNFSFSLYSLSLDLKF